MNRTIQASLPHIVWIDLHNDGVMHECALMKEDELGNKYIFELASLDRIDKGRLTRILQDRNVESFELWDLMANVTLNNGVNALEYFHQLVKVLTPEGKIISPHTSVRGAPSTIDTNVDPMATAKQRLAEKEEAEKVVQETKKKK